VSASLVYPIGLAAALGAALTMLVIRLRISRDRRLIRAELERRKCRLVSVRLSSERFAYFGSRVYDVDYRDPEDDPAHATATVARGAASWGDEVGVDTTAGMRFAGQDLPTYGQNWRG
jgi:hypothetical protein